MYFCLKSSAYAIWTHTEALSMKRTQRHPLLDTVFGASEWDLTSLFLLMVCLLASMIPECR